MPLLIDLDNHTIINLDRLSSARLLQPGDHPAGLPVEMKHLDLATGRLTQAVLMLEVSGRFHQIAGEDAERLFGFLSHSSVAV